MGSNVEVTVRWTAGLGSKLLRFLDKFAKDAFVKNDSDATLLIAANSNVTGITLIVQG